MKNLSLLLVILFIQVAVFSNLANAQLYVDGAVVTVQDQAELYVEGDFTTAKTGTTNPDIDNAGRIVVGGNAVVHADSDIKGIGPIVMMGSAKQTIDAAASISHLDIDNSSNVELLSDLSITSELAMTDGLLLAGNNNVTLGSTAVINGYAETRFISLDDAGTMTATVTDDQVIFPIGRSTPSVVALEDGEGAEYTVGVSNGIYTNPATKTGLQTADVVGITWNVQSSKVQADVFMTAQWLASDEETGFDNQTVYMSSWEDGVSSSWDYGTSQVAQGTDPYTADRNLDFSTNKSYVGMWSKIATTQAKDFVPVVLSGFNEDIIAEGTGGNSEAVTSVTFDLPDAGGTHVMYSKEFRYGTGTGDDGVPNDGIISSESNTGINYQLEDFDGNNVLLLLDDDSKELTLTKPDVYNKLSILAASANAASSFKVTVHYSDATTEEVSFDVPDWFNGENYAVKGLGRVKRNTAPATGDYDAAPENPRLYDNLLEVNPNKLITKLTFSKENSNGRTGIFAICGLTPAGAPDAPVAEVATDVVKSTSFTANWAQVTGATGYNLDVATDADFNNMLTGYNNKDVGNVTTESVATTESTVYYRVRAYNADGQSLSSNVITVDVALGLTTPEQAGINMYPNPFSNVLNITSSNGPVESVTIRDIAGKVVYQSQYGFENASINATTLKPGLYNVSFEKEGILIAAKVLKL